MKIKGLEIYIIKEKKKIGCPNCIRFRNRILKKSCHDLKFLFKLKDCNFISFRTIELIIKKRRF